MQVQALVPELAVDGEDGPAPKKGPYTGPTLLEELSHDPSHRWPRSGREGFSRPCADASGHTIAGKKLARRELLAFFAALPLCLIGIEAYATAHNWVCQLQGPGQDVRLIPPGYVKPFARRGAKNDASDGEDEAQTRL